MGTGPVRTESARGTIVLRSFFCIIVAMTPEERKMLEEAVALSRENNAILRKMRRSALVSSFFRILYIVVILGITFGSYYLIQPYIDQFKGVYGTVQDGVGKVQNAGSSLGNLTDLLESLKAGQ